MEIHVNFSESGTYVAHYRNGYGDLLIELRLKSGQIQTFPAWQCTGKTQEARDFIIELSYKKSQNETLRLLAHANGVVRVISYREKESRVLKL